MPAEPVSRPWRRFLRLSVRGLIVLVLVIGAWLGWLVRSARIQREAVVAIEDAGGAVSYDWDRMSGNVSVGRPWAPEWLVDLIGVDYFGHVTEAWVDETSTVTDGVIAKAECLTQVHNLVLFSTSVSDAGLSHLRGLTKLNRLHLGDTEITDAGLANLKGLSNLGQLYVNGTQITDVGLIHLKGLVNLDVLDVKRTRVTDAGLVHLKALTNLEHLDLSATQVTDAGLVPKQV